MTIQQEGTLFYMPIATVAALFVKIILMVLLGLVLKKCRLIDARVQKGLSDLLMCAVLPFSVLASANSPFSAELAQKLGVAAIIATVYYVVALVAAWLLMGRLLKNKAADVVKARRGILTTMSVFANTGFIGLPVVKALYGTEGFLYGVIYNLAYQLFLFTIGTQLLSGEKKFQWRAIIADPATMASIAAVVIYLSPFRFPAMLNDAFEEIGNMCVPLSRIVIGCCISDVKPRQLVQDKLTFVVSALRLAVFPLLMLFILRLTGCTGALAASCVVITALPVGSLNVIMAQRYHADAALATCTVLQSMVLMIVTLPLMLAAINLVLY